MTPRPSRLLILLCPPPAEGTAEIKARVAAARAIQSERFGEPTRDTQRPVNADTPTADLERIAAPDEAGATLLSEAAAKLHLTARGYHRVLKVSRTIADLEGASRVKRIHIAEALTYRRRAPGQTEGVKQGALAR